MSRSPAPRSTDSAQRARAPRRSASAPIGAWLIDAETRSAARLPGRMERFDIDAGSTARSGRSGRRACAVQHRRRLARSRPRARSRPGRASRSSRSRRQGRARFRRRTRQARLGDRVHRSAGIEPGPPAGGVARRSQRLSGSTSEVEPDASRALERGLELARQANAWLIVTGSLYLVGALRSAIGEAAQTPHETRAAPDFGHAPVGGRG